MKKITLVGCFFILMGLPVKNLAQCNQQVGDNTYFIHFRGWIGIGQGFSQSVVIDGRINFSVERGEKFYLSGEAFIKDGIAGVFDNFKGPLWIESVSDGTEEEDENLYQEALLPGSNKIYVRDVPNCFVYTVEIKDLIKEDKNNIEKLSLGIFESIFEAFKYENDIIGQVVWEYSLDNTNWREITTNRSQTNDKLDITNIDLGVDYHRTIYFRYKLPVYNYNNIQSGCIVSSSVPYIFVPSSPKLVGSPSLSHPLCSEDTNGGVTFTFDRELAEGEVMNLQLWRVTPEGDIGQDGAIANVPNTSMNGTSYQWPREIPPGTYYLEYSAKASGSSSFSSAEKSSNFTITAPEPLTLEMVSKKDISCQGGSDGSITIQITGGTPPYQYQVGGGAWSVPTSLTEHTITGLGSGTHSIRIKDSKGCLPQE